jgi:hypothetical protein
MLVNPEQEYQISGRCKFRLCPWRTNISREVSTSTPYILAWSEWTLDTRRNQWGRYRLSQGDYEYD